MDADPDIGQLTEATTLLDRDPERAFYLLLEHARRGSVWSMLNLGWCCSVGRGTSLSLPDAEYWYRRAHEAGCDRASIDYAGILRDRGAVDLEARVYATGVARDWPPALHASARLGLSQARTLKERLAAKLLLERAAEHGSPAARFLLARHKLRGSFGLRHVPAGIRLGWQIVKEHLARIDEERAQSAAEDSAPSPSATRH